MVDLMQTDLIQTGGAGPAGLAAAITLTSGGSGLVDPEPAVANERGNHTIVDKEIKMATDPVCGMTGDERAAACAFVGKVVSP